MKKRDKLLLAGKIYMMKDFFDFQSKNEKNLDSVVIEVIEETGDEFEHHDNDKVNQIIFKPKTVSLANSKQYIFIPDVFYNYMEVKETKRANKKSFSIKLKDIEAPHFMDAFQIAYNRMKFEETHSQNSPKEFEDKLVKEMTPFEKVKKK